MELADNPKLRLPSCELHELENAVVSEKVLISDQTNRFQYKSNPESFVIEMDSFFNKEISQNSRITRNLSRKGILRGSSKSAHDDGGFETGESISPIDGAAVGGSSNSMVEKQAVMGLGSRDELGGCNGGGGSALSHEIAITTGSGSGSADRLSFRRNSFKRSAQGCSWYLDPKKIFLFCATLSCVGTMLLIYFAFSSGMLNVEESKLD